jgi:hypothetical protein
LTWQMPQSILRAMSSRSLRGRTGKLLMSV